MGESILTSPNCSEGFTSAFLLPFFYPYFLCFFSHHSSASSWKKVSMHTRKVSQCMNRYPLHISNFSLYLLCLWRHNVARSILRRLGNVWFSRSSAILENWSRRKVWHSVRAHRRQAKSFKRGITSRAGLLVPRYHCFTLRAEHGNVFFPSLLFILCNTHDFFKAMEVYLGSTVLIHCCKKTIGITWSLCAWCYMQAAPQKSSLLWATLFRSALHTWQVCPAAGTVHPFRIASLAQRSSGISKSLKSEL